jgi:hypothetical protein
MNKKIVWAILFTTLLTLPLASVHVVKADGNGPIHFSDGVTLLSPVNATYNSRFLTLNYTFECGWVHYSLNYSLDGVYGGPMPYTIINPQENHVVYSSKGSVQLPELSEGTHKLAVDLEADLADVRLYSDTVYFTIDTNAPDFNLDATAPNITIQSPQNNSTYSSTEVPLNFLLSEPTVAVTLRLDDNTTTIPAKNSTLEGLSVGTHTLTMLAVDNAGNIGESKYIQFIVTNPTPTTLEPTKQVESSQAPQFSLIFVLLSVLAAACFVGVIAFMNFNKKKPKTS